jgi:hypothetical protein
MERMPRTRTGLLIIRAWVEPGSSEPLRAHIRLTSDIQAGFEQEMTLASIVSVTTAIEGWLEHILSAESAA